MNEFVMPLVFLLLLVIGAYLFGRLFAKGVFKEIDIILGKKFVEHLNNKNKKKRKDNGNKEKEVQFQREDGE